MIIYTNEQGNVCSCTLMSSVPEGITGYEVEAPADKAFRDAWTLTAGTLGINLDKAKLIKVKQAQGLSNDMMKAITDNYDAHEIATWGIQEAEARGDQPDNYLLALAAASGIPIAELKDKVIANSDAYRNASATAVGKRQKMEKACMAASTIEELKLVEF